MNAEITPFRIASTDSELVRGTRWPERESVVDWSQGMPLAYAQELCRYSLNKYDWRQREAPLNRFTQFNAGQLTWILEKFWAWTDCDGHPENVLTRDEMLDNVMLGWLPATPTSSARLYWEA